MRPEPQDLDSKPDVSRPEVEDLAYQEAILQGVSRTFALTIPQLPGTLCRVVSNGYLLCRIADTIEDEPCLRPEQKDEFSRRFSDVISGTEDSGKFAADLFPMLSDTMLETERDLVRNTPRVIRITHSFTERQRGALVRCVRIMSRGMASFQSQESPHGLKNLAELDRYCYFVAGVVGEMLTEVFCDYSDEIDAHRDQLMALAVSFGQGLQMTNILKDVWEDQARGACWLPADVFRQAGFDLAKLAPGQLDPAFHAGMMELIGIAKLHLENALGYTLMIPRHETGIRRFCLWAVGMAVLSLRKLHRRLDYATGQDVKISRRSVKATVLITSVLVRQDQMLRLLFDWMSRGLPEAANGQRVVTT